MVISTGVNVVISMDVDMVAEVDVTEGAVRSMIFLTNLCQKLRLRESIKHRALAPV